MGWPEPMSIGELTLPLVCHVVVSATESCHQVMKAGEFTLPLTSCGSQERSSAPCLGSRVGLALLAWAWVSLPEGMRAGELALALPAMALNELVEVVLAYLPWWCGYKKTGVQLSLRPSPTSTPSLRCWST